MATLVTGGSGVLGLHVAKRLAQDGETVVSYSTSGRPETADSVLEESRKYVRFVTGNILDFDYLRRTLDEYDISGVIHAAALTGEAQARARPHDVFSVNVGGTLNVLEAARQRRLRRVVYIGSASEYGKREDLRPIRENEERPEGMYAETKYLGHRLSARYREVFGVDVITVRVSSAYGPGTRFNPHRKFVGNTLIAHLCRSVAFGQSVMLGACADYPRDWTHACDTALGVCLAYFVKNPRQFVYNIASGISYKVRDVIKILRKIDDDIDIEARDGCWDEDPFQAGNLRGPLDISLAREDLSYEPQIDLGTGLRNYIDWWRNVAEDKPRATNA